MGAKSNLLKYMELRGIKKPEFYKKTGLSNGFLDKNENISSNNIEIIISNYADLSVEWLITGKGDMLKSDGSDTTNNDVIEAYKATIKAQETTISSQNRQIEMLERLLNESDENRGGGKATTMAG